MRTTIDSIKKDFDTLFYQPFRTASEEDFRTALEDKLDNISAFIRYQSNNIPDDFILKNEVLRLAKTIEETSENIKLSIADYYNGRPDIAYKSFESILIDLFQRGLLQKQIYQRVPFYRLRVFTDSAFTKREDIFHIPFKRRTLVAPQRFSIAGFPCLYLANSVYTAWEELHRPALENLCFAKFISQLPLSFIDLSLQNFKTRIDESEDYLILFENIAIYSILVACSIKVAFPTHSFKPEYIFPQFVLRWCKEENDIDGVMYDSTRIHAKSVGSFQNFVIPVADYQRNTDFCPNLTGKLKLTLPYMIDHLSDSQIIENELITDISQIFSKELHGIIPFQESIFARIESFLQNQELRRLS